MPSTTPNYGWQYPVSSDDLTAGASQIGTMITAADASLAAEAATRAAADSTLQANINAKITSGSTPVVAAIMFTALTTNASGQFTISGVNSNNTNWGTCMAHAVAIPLNIAGDLNTPTVWTAWRSDGVLMANTTIYLNYWKVA